MHVNQLCLQCTAQMSLVFLIPLALALSLVSHMSPMLNGSCFVPLCIHGAMYGANA